MARPRRIETREQYHVFTPVTTRWKDNDVYGHINNAVYNAWMDTAVTLYFKQQWPELPNTPIIPVAADTWMSFRVPIIHPAEIETGLRVEHLGNSSVKCGVGVFVRGDSDASAWGHMVHVWVDKESNQAVAIPDHVRPGLEAVKW